MSERTLFQRFERVCAWGIIGLALWEFFRGAHKGMAWAAVAGWYRWLIVT